MLFNTGFIYEVARDHPVSVSLSQNWVDKRGNAEERAILYTALTPEQDVRSAEWLFMNRESRDEIWATANDVRVHALTSYGMIPDEDVNVIIITEKEEKDVDKDAYVYMQRLNVIDGLGTQFNPALPVEKRTKQSTYDISEIAYLFDDKDKVYSNVASEIYK